MDSLKDVYSTKLNGKRAIEVNNPISESPSVEHFMFQELGAVTILNNPVKGSSELTLSPGHGFVPPVAPNRDYLNIHYHDVDISGFVGTRFSQFSISAVVGDVITINPPLPYDFVTGKEERVQRVNVNMAIDASGGPVKFQSFPPDGQGWDLYRIIGDMILGTAGDDGKFGNQPALAKGLYFGFESAEYTEYSASIYDNGGFRATAYDLIYPLRSGGGGDFGMSFRKTLTKTGSIIALNGNNQRFVMYVQDKLDLISRFRIRIGGNISLERG